MNTDSERPVVACYCATFLKPEMLHIYRQITALERVRPVVIAQKREEPGRFPFPDVTVIPVSADKGEGIKDLKSQLSNWLNAAETNAALAVETVGSSTSD